MLMDINPVTMGHALIISKQHYATFFDVPPVVMRDMYQLLSEAKNYLVKIYHPDGFNIDVNVGPVGGQKIMHCHIHLIPRYRGQPGSSEPMQFHLPHEV